MRQILAALARLSPREWLGLLLLLLAWQALFWLLVHQTERAARPAAIDARSQVIYELQDAQGLPTGGAAARGVATRQGLDGYEVSIPDSAKRVRFEVDFVLPPQPEPQALYLAIREEISEIRLNGMIIQSANPLPKLAGLMTSEPAYYHLPSRLLRPGTNHLVIDKETTGLQSALSEFAIGPAEVMARSFRVRNFLLTDLALIGVGILAFSLLLCLAVNWPDEDKARIRALMLLLASCAAGTGFLTFSPPVALGLFAFVMLWSALNLAMAVAIAVFVLHEIRAPSVWVRWVYRLWPLLQGLFLLAFLALALLPSQLLFWLTTLVNAGYLLVCVAGGLAVLLLAWTLVREHGRQLLERSVLALCCSALVMDRVGSMVDLHSPFDAALPLTLPWSQIIGAFLGLAMVLALAREAALARRTVIDSNRLLTERLNQREAELAASFAERTQMQRQAAVLEERQRLVRDMHDGIGGKLVGLRLQAAQLDAAGMESALDDSLADLRLIVDSLDTAEDELIDALIAFERRVRPQVQAAGCALEVKHAEALAGVQLGPRASLQVMRILQEALTNALRHAHAKHIALSVGFAAPGVLEFVLQDDGRGLDPLAPAGLGLNNMRQRAQSLGARFALESTQPGTRITLQLDLPAAAPSLGVLGRG